MFLESIGHGDDARKSAELQLIRRVVEPAFAERVPGPAMGGGESRRGKPVREAGGIEAGFVVVRVYQIRLEVIDDLI